MLSIENPPLFFRLLARNFRNLRALDMSYVNISSEIPHELSYMQSLRSLHLENCYLVGEFPNSVFLIPNLQSIILDSNPDLRGKLPVFHKNNSMQVLSLQGTSFSGIIPDSIGNLKDLASLTLTESNFSGMIPFSLGELVNLSRLFLFLNHFTGGVPSSVGDLKHLTLFNVADNHLTGNFPSALLNLTELRAIVLDSNQFTGSLPPNIGQLSKLAGFFASDNFFTGAVPSSLFQISPLSSLTELNLRNNSLSGSLPDMFMYANELISIDISHNRLEGKLPSSLTACSTLEILNVESNKIKDTFPFHLSSLKKLQVLVLRSNKFHGMLYQSDGAWLGFPQLKIIDVSHNDFVGTLPSDYFLNWTAISSNKDKSTRPNYIGSYNSGYYTSVVLMNKGVSMEMERILTVYTVIDFSGNRIHGEVPESVGLLKELHVLNLSRNAFTGNIPSSLANITALESLDLSQNKFSGEIPPKLGDLSSLEWINVSHNQLVGSIPQGTQFQRQTCSSYEGNPELYGPSLKDICGDIHPLTSPPASLEEEEERMSWTAAGLGFAPGVIFGLTIGYMVVSYKHEWFMKILGRNKHRSTVSSSISHP